jgi:glycosyltransferase involved in cell wall biosynthesis
MSSICFLITGLNIGGAEVQLVNVVRRLQLLGWKPVVISMLPAEGRLADELKFAGIAVRSLHMRTGVPDPRAILRLILTLRRIRPVVLHSHMVHANLLARIAVLLWRSPKLICTIHNVKDGGRFRQIAYRATDSIPELTTVVSYAAGAQFLHTRAVSPSRMRVIPNGIDIEKFAPDRKARAFVRQSLALGAHFVWLAAGRFDAQKDYPNMLRAFARLRPANAILLIAGKGPFKAEAERLLQELRIEDQVKLLGLRDDIPQLMNGADAYVLSSQWEGLPLVLLEAAATGLPVVATRVGGNDEIVLDKKTGLLVPPQDSCALAKAMDWIMRMDEVQSREMQRAAREYVVANYSLDAIVAKWDAIYRDMLSVEALPLCSLNRPAPAAAR